MYMYVCITFILQLEDALGSALGVSDMSLRLQLMDYLLYTDGAALSAKPVCYGKFVIRK